MKHLCALCGFLLFFMASTRAQTEQAPPAQPPPAQAPAKAPPAQPPPPQEIEIAPFEISAGYTLRVFTQSNYARIGLNGAYGSVEYNILSRIGAIAEVTGGRRNQGPNGDLSIYSILVGPQIYPFKHRRKFTPFAHVLFGEGFYRNDYPAYGGFPRTVTTDAAFSWEAGGGLDVVHSTHWEIRLIQLDFAQTKFLGNQSQTNYRGSIGIVYRFGEKN